MAFDKISFQTSGEYYGYPECCIKEFIHTCERGKNPNNHPTKDDKLRFRMSHVNGVYSGFIPCLQHAKLIAIGKIKLSDLIKNRHTNLQPFPFDWSLK